MVRSMGEGNLTPSAAVLWGAIPRASRERILRHVFCVKCEGAVGIIDVRGEEQDGDVILRGRCATCGHEVARVVETSEADHSGN
jgi:hypothetical protein